MNQPWQMSVRTLRGRILDALFSGAVVGGFLLTIFAVGLLIASGYFIRHPPWTGALWLLVFCGVSLISLTVMFFFGLSIFAVPIWLFLHLIGLRDRWTATLFGGIYLVCAWTYFTLPYGWPTQPDAFAMEHFKRGTYWCILIMFAVGASVGSTIWYSAYRRMLLPPRDKDHYIISGTDEVLK